VPGVPTELPVRVFAAFADLVGAPYTTVSVSTPATVADVRAALAARWPAAMARAPIAVNLAYAGDDAPVAPGDEIALIAPVAGG
jgi:molybdopterin converting factor small subunit